MDRHDHLLADQGEHPVDRPHVGTCVHDDPADLVAELLVYDLSTPEPDPHLEGLSPFQDASGLADLHLKIVVPDVGADLNLPDALGLPQWNLAMASSVTPSGQCPRLTSANVLSARKSPMILWNSPPKKA